MKHLFITLALLVAAAAAAGVVAFRATGDPAVKAALAQRDAMTWLRTEFALSDEQFAKVKALHDSYSNTCEEHCRAIQRAARAKEALRRSAEANPADLAAAEQRLAELRAVCESAIAAHVRRCAAEMSPESGARYLAMMLPRIADFDHHAPPDVGLSSHRH